MGVTSFNRVVCGVVLTLSEKTPGCADRYGGSAVRSMEQLTLMSWPIENSTGMWSIPIAEMHASPAGVASPGRTTRPNING